MKIIAINGSPRKNSNTAVLLEHALEGASLQGAETELINLYDLDYKGCMSCFACKLKGGKSYGKCAYKDELSPVLEKVLAADALLLGSPIYFHAVTGEMRSFLERLMFPILTYTEDYKGLLKKKIPVGFIYNMNVTKEYMIEANYLQVLRFAENSLESLFGSCESLAVNDTLQFKDYSKYVVTVFDENKKKKVKEEQFPIDCESAFQLGSRLIQRVIFH
ncbi:flavodoxin family protein [Clostridium sp. KNHs205]|jgi:multimeric flavodoxin WrbA|uniref:flavodoxin family protein n=1 Tax=Clostridium sp. KNHs205 TaxID=1449050 RepID=UPI00051B55D3|nr:flavodoxin family protein [Clostridium sp. KNHs205]